jgi:hypothetical protein
MGKVVSIILACIGLFLTMEHRMDATKERGEIKEDISRIEEKQDQMYTLLEDAEPSKMRPRSDLISKSGTDIRFLPTAENIGFTTGEPLTASSALPSLDDAVIKPDEEMTYWQQQQQQQQVNMVRELKRIESEETKQLDDMVSEFKKITLAYDKRKSMKSTVARENRRNEGLLLSYRRQLESISDDIKKTNPPFHIYILVENTRAMLNEPY